MSLLERLLVVLLIMTLLALLPECSMSHQRLPVMCYPRVVLSQCVCPKRSWRGVELSQVTQVAPIALEPPNADREEVEGVECIWHR